MLTRQHIHQLCEIHLCFLLTGLSRLLCNQVLNELEHCDDVSFVLISEFRNKQYGGGEETFCSIVKEAVLTVVSVTTADVDDCFCCDFRILFGLCFC